MPDPIPLTQLQQMLATDAHPEPVRALLDEIAKTTPWCHHPASAKPRTLIML